MSESALLHKNSLPKDSKNYLEIVQSHCVDKEDFYVEIIDGDWILRVRKVRAREDEDSHALISLGGIWLPPTLVHPRPQLLIQQPKYAAAISLAAEKYVRKSQKSKSRVRRLGVLISALAKFIELSYLRGKYDFNDWSAEELHEVSQSLNQGWHKELQIYTRLIRYMQQGYSKSRLLMRPESKLKSISAKGFQEALGTNIFGSELFRYRDCIVQALATPMGANDPSLYLLSLPSDDKPVSRSQLYNQLQLINGIYDLPSELGMSRMPFPNALRISKRKGRSQGRTANLPVDMVAKLLTKAFHWIYKVGPELYSLFKELSDAQIRSHKNGRKVVGHEFQQVLNDSIHISNLRSLGVDIGGIDKEKSRGGNHTVRSAHLCLLTASFIVLATMNARRRDELLDRAVGIHLDSVSPLNVEMELYEGLFYIEKTFQTHIKFNVNKTTFEVVKMLGDFYLLFDRLDTQLDRAPKHSTPSTEKTLFTYRRLSPLNGIGSKKRWFKFNSDASGHAEPFLSEALASDFEFRPAPHTFRRFYALVFFYRFQHGDLLALAQQLGHFDLQTTLTYITDPESRNDLERIENLIGNKSPVYEAIKDHHQAIQAELGEIADEKLMDNVLHALEGNASGGWQKQVLHFYKKIHGKVEFADLDKKALVPVIGQHFKERGHRPTPFRHGECMAGAARDIHLGLCHSDEESRLQRELAGPKMCGTCPFHFVNQDYLDSLRNQLEILLKQLEDPTLTAIHKNRLVTDQDNLRSAIELHEIRITGRIEAQNE